MGAGGNRDAKPPKRERISGWTMGAAKRQRLWLWSVVPGMLTGTGWAVTLTVRDLPSSTEWTRLRKTYLQALRDSGLLLRAHWVTEWQARGVPHLHLAVYLAEGTGERTAVRLLTGAWLGRTQHLHSGPMGQDCQRIRDSLGWSKYLAKHAARGVAHYQRQGKPPGWDATGRLWGYVGDWPTELPTEGRVDYPTFHRMRRLGRSYAVAEARSAALHGRGSWRAVKAARECLRCPDRFISHQRGFSAWIPRTVWPRLLEVAES